MSAIEQYNRDVAKLKELKECQAGNEALDEPDLEQRRLIEIAIGFQEFYVSVSELDVPG